jgi:hypothetical protein
MGFSSSTSIVAGTSSTHFSSTCYKVIQHWKLLFMGWHGFFEKERKERQKEKKTIATKSSGFLNAEGISSLVQMQECDFAVQTLSYEGYHDKC